ncbi:hypothetical protein WJX72_010120 [[Myrmecia] bisecta]|uniref:Uncharacterized protein n=1 Tax=[Myrmecia] bisecta TaxID=41462 RepID=A0AAW1QSE0_9CHLO
MGSTPCLSSLLSDSHNKQQLAHAAGNTYKVAETCQSTVSLGHIEIQDVRLQPPGAVVLDNLDLLPPILQKLQGANVCR